MKVDNNFYGMKSSSIHHDSRGVLEQIVTEFGGRTPMSLNDP